MFAQLAPGPLVRLFARPYVAGGTLDEGLAKARQLLRDHLVLTTLDLLGEAVTDPAEVADNVRTYRQLVDELAADPLYRRSGYRPWSGCRPTVSLKPTAFTTGPMDEAAEAIRELCRYAGSQGVGVTIDMEDHRYTDFTIDLAVGLYQEGLDVGTVLQSRLHRTEADLARIPAGMRLRLVIGIYPEPAEIALTSKPEMKAQMVRFADLLLDRGARVEFATHDEGTLEQFLGEVAPKAPDRCEIQMLLGVPRRRFVERMRAAEFGADVPVRLYVPFANSWIDATAYLRRRMVESPSVMWLVLRNLLPSRAG